MKLSLVCVGSFKRSAEKELFQTFAERIGWQLDLKEIPQSKRKEPDKIKAEEGSAILNAVNGYDIVVAMEPKSKELSSPEFSKLLSKWQDEGFKKCAFIIGGAEGLSEPVLKRATMAISFGRAIWPHILCRIMLTEQIYRAWTILNNHPYHRE